MLFDFTKRLLESGRVEIHSGVVEPFDTQDRERTFSLLADFEANYRHSLPADPPDFSTESGLWAAEQFFLACYYMFNREIPEQELQQVFTDHFSKIKKNEFTKTLLYCSNTTDNRLFRIFWTNAKRHGRFSFIKPRMGWSCQTTFGLVIGFYVLFRHCQSLFDLV